MCVTGCLDVVRRNLNRREALVASATAAVPIASWVAGGRSRNRPRFREFNRVVDLTHTYSYRFPHFNGQRAHVKKEILSSLAGGGGWNTFRWTIDEHAGTHIDAPFHRNPNGKTVDQIPPEDLVLPLVIVDISDKASKDPDSVVNSEDIRNWETAHGKIPPHSCVAMNSGWDAKIHTDSFIGMDRSAVRHFPGFGADAVEFLLRERNVAAIAVDTASLDHGPSIDFPVHTLWLGENRFGIENIASLGKLPATGSTIVIGAPKIAGATGGPARILALV